MAAITHKLERYKNPWQELKVSSHPHTAPGGQDKSQRSSTLAACCSMHTTASRTRVTKGSPVSYETMLNLRFLLQCLGSSSNHDEQGSRAAVRYTIPGFHVINNPISVCSNLNSQPCCSALAFPCHSLPTVPTRARPTRRRRTVSSCAWCTSWATGTGTTSKRRSGAPGASASTGSSRAGHHRSCHEGAVGWDLEGCQEAAQPHGLTTCLCDPLACIAGFNL